MTRRRHPGWRRGRGQALVEFALVAPVLFLVLFSIIEFGRAVYYVQVLDNAAREGTRYAIVHGADSGCPSGPMPGTLTNYCDPDGSRVVLRTKDAAIAVIDAGPSEFDVSVRWCATSACPDTNVLSQGDGSNGRNQTVTVGITYAFKPWISTVVPLPAFTIKGGSSLVVNH